MCFKKKTIASLQIWLSCLKLSFLLVGWLMQIVALFLLLLLSTSMLHATEASPQPPSAPEVEATAHPAPKIWNLRDADIRAVITEISRVTGKNFLVDPRVQGKISIISGSPLS